MVEKPPRNLFMCWTQEQSDWSKLFNTWIGLWNKEKEFCCRPLKGGKNSLPGIAFEICMSSVWVAMVADCPMAVATSLPKSLTQPTTHKKLLHTTKPLQRVNPRPRPYVWAWGCQIMQKKRRVLVATGFEPPLRQREESACKGQSCQASGILNQKLSLEFLIRVLTFW